MKSRRFNTWVVLILIISFLAIVSCNFITVTGKLVGLRQEVFNDLTADILPYWSEIVADNVNGGFYGRVDANDTVYRDAERGGVVNSRILWTYSAAFRVLKDSSYFFVAKHQMDYIVNHFIDRQYGGAYRSVSSKGEPMDTRKQIYIESFFMYAFSEYSRATGDTSALREAKNIYAYIERYAFDKENNGYFEVFTRDWQRSHDRLIGEKTEKEEKTMNTHLHLLESYTSLYRIWPDPGLKEKLRNLIDIFLDKIIDKERNHLISFMERDWKKTSNLDSYGHDIECSWLLCEAANVLGDPELESQIKDISIRIADAATEGLFKDGSMTTEKDLETGKVRSTRSWWEQAETIIGYLNAYEVSGSSKYLDHAYRCWDYVRDHFIDFKDGGWYSNVNADGTPGKSDKAGFWICPYHNGRMELEIIERVKE